MRGGPPLNIGARHARTASLSVKPACAASKVALEMRSSSRRLYFARRRAECRNGEATHPAMLHRWRARRGCVRPGPDARSAGFDYDLAHLFAQRHNLVLKVVAASNPGAKLAAGDSGASLGAGATFRPDMRNAATPESALLYSAGYYAVEPVLIYNTDSFRPVSWADLAGSSVAVLEGTALSTALHSVRADHAEVIWQPLALASTEALVRQVSDGSIDYAIVASNEAEALRNVHLNFERAFAVAGKQELVWVFPPAQVLLRDQGDAFCSHLKK